MVLGGVLGGALGTVLVIVVIIILVSRASKQANLGQQIQQAGFQAGRQIGIAVTQLPGTVAINTGEQIQRSITGGKLFSELGNQNQGGCEFGGL